MNGSEIITLVFGFLVGAFLVRLMYRKRVREALAPFSLMPDGRIAFGSLFLSDKEFVRGIKRLAEDFGAHLRRYPEDNHAESRVPKDRP